MTYAQKALDRAWKPRKPVALWRYFLAGFLCALPVFATVLLLWERLR